MIDWIEYESTSTCNGSCTYPCYVYCKSEKANGGPNLNLDELETIMSDMKREGVKRLYILGGEPFLGTDIMDVLMDANNTIDYVCVSTNGSHITSGIAQKLTQMPCIEVSLDCHIEIINNATRPGLYSAAIKAIDLLIQANTYVCVNTVVTSQNYDHLNNFFDFCWLKRIKAINLYYPMGKVNPDLIVPANKLTALEENLKNKYQVHIQKSCPLGKHLYITSQGKVYPCAAYIGTTHNLGTIKHKKLQNILAVTPDFPLPQCAYISQESNFKENNRNKNNKYCLRCNYKAPKLKRLAPNVALKNLIIKRLKWHVM